MTNAEIADKLLDLRNKYDGLFDDYKGDVVVEEFRGEIDILLKEITA